MVNEIYCDCCGELIENEAESKGQFFEHPDGYSLPLGLLQKIHTRIEMKLPSMEPKVPYSLPNILGKTRWYRLSKHERLLAYVCVAYLIEYEGLPIEIEGWSGKKGYLFQLK